MSHPEYNIKDEELGEPAISLTTMWFLLAIVISFAAGFVTFGYIAPKPAAFVQVRGEKSFGYEPMTTVRRCKEMLDEVNKNERAYAELHLGEPANDLHSYCIQ